MIDPAKRAVKRVVRLAGLDLRRDIPAERNYAWLAPYGIQTVFDIGANVGQFALQIHRVLPAAAIYSFEPIAECHRRLAAAAAKIEGVRTFPLALGDRNGQARIHRNEFTPSSSLLEMNELHRQAFPHTKRSAAETITVRRLDDVARELRVRGGILVKIDVQGYEDKVIAGGRETLARAGVLIIETSFRELYRGQATFADLYRDLVGMGFSYAGALDQLRNPEDGSILQADSLFLRPPDGRS